MGIFKKWLNEQEISRRGFLGTAGKTIAGAATGSFLSGNNAAHGDWEDDVANELINSQNPYEVLKKYGPRYYEKILDGLNFAATKASNNHQTKEKINKLINAINALIKERDRANDAIKQTIERNKEQQAWIRHAQVEIPRLALKVQEDDLGQEILAKEILKVKNILKPQEVMDILKKDRRIKNANTVLRSAASRSKELEQWFGSIIDWNY